MVKDERTKEEEREEMMMKDEGCEIIRGEYVVFSLVESLLLTCDCDPRLNDPPSGRKRPVRATRAHARADSDPGEEASGPSAKTGRDH